MKFQHTLLGIPVGICKRVESSCQIRNSSNSCKRIRSTRGQIGQRNAIRFLRARFSDTLESLRPYSRQRAYTFEQVGYHFVVYTRALYHNHRIDISDTQEQRVTHVVWLSGRSP